MPLSEAGRQAMTYWGEIRQVASQRGTSSDIWSAIRASAEAVPGGAPLPPLAGVNEVWSAAVALRRTGEAFSKALDLEQRSGLPQSITSDMLTTAPWTRQNLEANQSYRFQVSFQGTFMTPDEKQLQQYLTVSFGPDQLPSTVGELLGALQTGVPNTSVPAGVDLIGLSDLSLVMV